jgi:hypothetical protein
VTNVVTPQHLEPGAEWAFVHRNGKTVEYVCERCMVPATASVDPKIPGLSAMYSLLNPQSGKLAMVSEKWLREGPVTGRSHWLPKKGAAA